MLTSHNVDRRPAWDSRGGLRAEASGAVLANSLGWRNLLENINSKQADFRQVGTFPNSQPHISKSGHRKRHEPLKHSQSTYVTSSLFFLQLLPTHYCKSSCILERW